MYQTFKKLASVSATSVPITYTRSNKVVRVPYIYYPIWFQESQRQKSQEQVRVLLNSVSKVNVMNPVFARKLGFHIQKTNVGAQKIDGSILETFGIVIANFQVKDKGGRPKFFQKNFPMADTKFKVILGMLFLKINNADVAFSEKTLTWKSYTTNKLLSTTKQV